jgi:hypothetical protein
MEVEVIDIDPPEEEKRKRKRKEGEESEDSEGSSSDLEVDPHAEYWQEMTILELAEKIDELHAIVGEKDRWEIQTITASLMSLAKVLEKEAGKSFRQKIGQERKMPRQEERENIAPAGTQASGTGKHTQTTTTCETGTQTDAENITGKAAPQTVEAGTQTAAWHHTTKPPTVGSLEGVKCFEDFEAIARLKWEEAVYRNVEVKLGNPLDTPHHTVKCVLVEPKDPEMNLSIQRHFRERFPDVASMEEEYGVLEQRNRKRGPGGSNIETLQRVVKIHHDGSERSIWGGLQALREDVQEAEEVAIHHVETLSEERLKSLTQAVFHGVDTKVTIFTTPSRRATNSKTLKERKRNTLALSVEVGDRSFKDVLRGVRAAVGGKPGCESIQSLRSTKEDKLLIVLGKDETAKDNVVKLLQAKNLKVKQVGPRERSEVVHLRGLDELATREEVKEAIEKIVGTDDNIKVVQ